MIPRKIHYCWFSNDPYPQLVKECIASWKKYMPDWEFVLWNYEKIKDIDSVWLKECLEAKKWAFAADYIRLWAVYHEGGVYLDSDVMAFQPLERFLQHRFFTGREGVAYPTFDDGIQVFLTSHCFGAESGHPFLKSNLAYYQDRHFKACSSEDIPILLRYDMLMMPYPQSRLAETYGYNPSLDADRLQILSEGMAIYPSSYFGKNIDGQHLSDCYVTHLGQGSWREPDYWVKHPKSVSISLSYKVRWRIVYLLKRWARRMDYIMYRIHPDGLE